MLLDQDRFEKIRKVFDLDKIDLDQVLPREIEELCTQYMKDYDDMDKKEDSSRPFLDEYLHLRNHLKRYELLDKLPRLRLLEKPDGGWERLKKFLGTVNVDLSELLAIDSDIDSFIDGE